MEWLAMALAPGEARKDFSADALFGSLLSRFASLPDPRSREVEIPLADALMSAFAMFSLKDPSLLAFDHRRHNPNDNFRTIYGINRVPCDSQMRDILDPLDPANCFASVGMGRTRRSNKLQSRAEVFPCPRKLGIASVSRRRSPSFGSISSKTPRFRGDGAEGWRPSPGH